MELGVTTTVSILNPDLGDLALDDAGQEVVRTTLADEVYQRLLVRFNFFRGEWFLNLDEGTPYYGEILVKNPSDRIIRLVFTTLILGTVGVAALPLFSYSLDSRARTLSLTFRATLRDGSVFSSADYPPFVMPI